MKTKTICLIVVASLLQSFLMKTLGETTKYLSITPGNLSIQLGSEKDLVTHLILTGEINGSDIGTIRSMSLLSVLDMGDVYLVEGGSFTVDGSVQLVTNNEIPSMMFYNMKKLTAVTIPNTITSIGAYAFDCCTGLTSITVPDNVQTLGIGAFHDCTGSTSVYIGKNLASIGLVAFSGSLNLKEFIVSAENTSFCTVDGALFNINKDKLIHFPNNRSTSYHVPDFVSSLDDYSFCSCYGLTSITLPNLLTSIGGGAFYNCTGLTELYCPVSNPPTVISNSFFNVNLVLCKLYVPYGTSSAYRNAVVWGDFTTIMEELPTAVHAEKSMNAIVYSEQDAIVIKNGGIGETVYVYSTFGTLILAIKVVDEELRIRVSANQIYLVKIAGKVVKVAV